LRTQPISSCHSQQFSGEPSTSINVGRSGVGAMDRDAVAQIDELVLDAIQ
jgi:hypothetical protein